MRDIIELASRIKSGNIKNIKLEKSLKIDIKEDRTMKIFTKELTEFILDLFDKKKKK